MGSDQEVAIKVLSPKLASDKSSVERLRREAGLARRLACGVDDAFDVGVADARFRSRQVGELGGSQAHREVELVLAFTDNGLGVAQCGDGAGAGSSEVVDAGAAAAAAAFAAAASAEPGPPKNKKKGHGRRSLESRYWNKH